jgi:FtsH-binding integral membrane protein
MTALAFPTNLAAAHGALESFWAEYGDPINVLLAYTVGILAYGLVINLFYQVLSHRVMLGRKQGKDRVATGARSFAYVIMFPLISFAFFLLLSGALLFLSSGSKSPQTIFTIAMAVVLAVRVAAYFSEATSHDLAKLLPLGLLGVFLVTGEVSTLADSLAQMGEIFRSWQLVLTFFVIVVFAEYLLRAFRALYRATQRKTPS